MVLVTILIVAVLMAVVLYPVYWLVTTRSHPRTQKTPPDLSAFQRGTENHEDSSHSELKRCEAEAGLIDEKAPILPVVATSRTAVICARRELRQ